MHQPTYQAMVGALFSAAIGTTLSVVLAVLVVSHAQTTFEAAAFLAALIGFRRLRWQVSEGNEAAAFGRYREEMWLHRLDLRFASNAEDLPEPLRNVPLHRYGVPDAIRDHGAGPWTADEKERLWIAVDDLDIQIRKLQRRQWVHRVAYGVTDVGLAAWLLLVLVA